jgi:hypothetical protein
LRSLDPRVGGRIRVLLAVAKTKGRQEFLFSPGDGELGHLGVDDFDRHAQVVLDGKEDAFFKG